MVSTSTDPNAKYRDEVSYNDLLRCLQIDQVPAPEMKGTKHDTEDIDKSIRDDMKSMDHLSPKAHTIA